MRAASWRTDRAPVSLSRSRHLPYPNSAWPCSGTFPNSFQRRTDSFVILLS